YKVTGVQTCALPSHGWRRRAPEARRRIVPGTLPEPEGRALVLSLWNIGATMQNISFEYFLTLSTN
ncbi:MAG TPA: hypothetical protein DCE09_05615, partial [Thermoanaerobacter sp.]|nr:hypothetical protein [Thermoanaerobacter sp.]